MAAVIENVEQILNPSLLTLALPSNRKANLWAILSIFYQFLTFSFFSSHHGFLNKIFWQVEKLTCSLHSWGWSVSRKQFKNKNFRKLCSISDWSEKMHKNSPETWIWCSKETIYHAVPVLGIPMTYEQRINKNIVTDKNIGNLLSSFTLISQP